MNEREQLRATVRDLSLEGITQAEIARKLGLRRNVVVGLVHRLRQKGHLPKVEKPDELSSEKVRALACAGKTEEEIAEELGLQVTTVVWHLKRLRAKGVVTPLSKLRGVVKISPKKPSAIRNNHGTLDAPTGTREPLGCRYIYGDPRDVWAYCSREVAPRGKTAMRGSHGTYCEGHLQVCYMKDPPKKKKKPEKAGPKKTSRFVTKEDIDEERGSV